VGGLLAVLVFTGSHQYHLHYTVQEKRTKSKPFTGMFAQQNGSIPDCNSQLSSITHG